MKIIMTDTERALLESLMASSSSYFEYGMGGSTVLASRLVSRRVAAVDSDQAWVDRVREAISSPKDIQLSCINIGKTRSWGYPVAGADKSLFPAYSKSILQHGSEINLCLVDGRFRVACFLTALSHLEGDAVIAIHDYTDRPHYHVVERFARPIAAAGTLRAFVRRPSATTAEIDKAAENCRYDPR